MEMIARGLALAALSLLFVSTSNAGQKEDTAKESGTVNTDRSRVYIYVPKKGRLGHDHGVIGRLKSGRIKLGAAQDAGELVFDMTSFLADTKEARRYVGLVGENDAGTRQQVTQQMLGGAVLDASNYPTAKFAISSAKQIKSRKEGDEPQYQLDGKFTLHGVTQPLSLVALAEEYEEELRVRGKFAILQTDYGIRPFSKAFGTVGVANQLTIWGDVLIKP